MRPKLICHMVSSIDGRLHPSRWSSDPSGNDREVMHRQYEETAEQIGADGWIVGRKTMAEMVSGTARSVTIPVSNLRETFVGDRQGRNLAVAIDPHGRLHYGADAVGGDHIVAVLGEGVPDAYLAELRADGVSYLFAGSDGDDLALAMDILGSAFGATQLLLEGGGTTNGTFLKAGLIDEISLLIYPAVDGLAGVASIFDYPGKPDERPAAGQVLSLINSQTLAGGTVWIRYRVDK